MRHYNWHRYYEPSVGRYIAADPIGQAGGMNVYAYALNSPIGLIDPFGLDPHNPPGKNQVQTNAQNKFGAQVSYGVDAAGAMGDFTSAYIDQLQSTYWYGHQYFANDPTYGFDDQDQYFHCRANCEAAQRGPGGVRAAQCISDAREAWDERFDNQSPADTARDQSSNAFGRSQGSANPSGDCRSLCGGLRPTSSKFPSRF